MPACPELFWSSSLPCEGSLLPPVEENIIGPQFDMLSWECPDFEIPCPCPTWTAEGTIDILPENEPPFVSLSVACEEDEDGCPTYNMNLELGIPEPPSDPCCLCGKFCCVGWNSSLSPQVSNTIVADAYLHDLCGNPFYTNVAAVEVTVTDGPMDATPSATAVLEPAVPPIGIFLSGAGTPQAIIQPAASNPAFAVAVVERARAVARYLWVDQARNSQVFVKACGPPAQVIYPGPAAPSIIDVSNWGQFEELPYTVHYTQASGTTLVVVAIGYLTSAAPIIPPAGWTLATSATSGSDFLGNQWNTDIFYLNNVPAGTYSWTFNFTGYTPSLGNIIIITGANATSPIDTTATSGGASSSASCGPTGTTAASNELVLCSIWNGVTNTNGYTLETQSTASGLPYLQTYGLTVASEGTQTCDFTTGTPALEYSAGLLTIKG